MNKPRIYTYKITFKEVPHYYYGVHKEKKYDDEYLGSPITHKHYWEHYTPQKEILKEFPCTDEGWIEANEEERSLIKPVYNTDPYCLNENCGGIISLEVSREVGKRNAQYYIENYSKHYTFRNPNGEIISGRNYTEFARKYNLAPSNVGFVLNGKRKSVSGWTLVNTESNYISPTTPKIIELKSPTGEIIRKVGLRKFCRKYNLNERAITNVIFGKKNNHKGWTLPHTNVLLSNKGNPIKFELKSPDGKIFKGDCVVTFAKEHGLNYSHLKLVLRGELNHHKGWTNPNIITKSKWSKEFTIKSPSGNIIEGKSIGKLCEEYNLKYSAISEVIGGKRKSHKGWTLPNTKVFGRELTAEKRSKEFIIKSPNGEIIKGKNISKFCKENNLSSSHLRDVISGKRKSHKGWTLP